MLVLPIWIAGSTRSGKTTRLVSEFRYWVQRQRNAKDLFYSIGQQKQPLTSSVLILAANEDNRRDLADRLSTSILGSYPISCKTPLGFITDEVILFWPLLFEILHLKAQFPLRLRPETEQELATRLWRSQIQDLVKETGVNEYRYVRNTLDLLQLAGASGIPIEDIPIILEQGLSEGDKARFLSDNEGGSFERIGRLILDWQTWCLERGLLSYGIIYELYWRYLLPNLQYQQQLTRRYQAIFADDVDDYPAIARELFDFFLDREAFGVFTYNPNGQIRLGLNADPHYLQQLASRCQVEELNYSQGLAVQLEETFIELIETPIFLSNLPEPILSLQTTSRAQMLRQTGDLVIQAIERGDVQPEDIVIIAPGLDEISRYTLIEILTGAGVAVKPLNEQRPLMSYPLIRSLLTLLALVYPGLGRLVSQDIVAEMLVILSRQPREEDRLVPQIDPVRAGLIADSCYHIDLESPCLLPIETFQRWDRLGHRATEAYNGILKWVEKAKILRQEQNLLPIALLDLAIKQLLDNGSYLPFDQLSALRELMETAQHFWEVDRKLRQNEPSFQSPIDTVAQFIQLIRRGTITANPYPISTFVKKSGSVTIANIFQYRSVRTLHRWQIWLDASSNLWDKGGAATLIGAPLFLREWTGGVWTDEDKYEEDRSRLQRILKDLLGRVSERIVLCHSDLSITGTEQTGPLLTLVQLSKEVEILAK